jgi:hypothetical protein
MTKEATEPEVSSTVKTTITLSNVAMKDVKDLATEKGISFAEVIRRAIWIEKYLHDEIKAGGKIQVVDAEKNVKELVLR